MDDASGNRRNRREGERGRNCSGRQEEVEAAKPKPVSKGNRRGSKALQLELEKTKELAAGNEEKYKRLLAEFENMRQRNEKESTEDV